MKILLAIIISMFSISVYASFKCVAMDNDGSLINIFVDAKSHQMIIDGEVVNAHAYLDPKNPKNEADFYSDKYVNSKYGYIYVAITLLKVPNLFRSIFVTFLNKDNKVLLQKDVSCHVIMK